MTPGWVKPCTCGKTERGAYCPECRGFGDGYSGGTWKRPILSKPTLDKARELLAEGKKLEAQKVILDELSEKECPGGHRGATIRGNAAYCAECGGRIKPMASSSYSHGTGH